MTALDHLTSTDPRIKPNCPCLGCILRRKERFEEKDHRHHQEQVQQFNLKIGAGLKALRGKISLRALGKTAGLSAPFISDCELGQRGLSPETAEKILRAIKELKS